LLHISTTPGSISYLAFSYFDSSIEAVSLDGVKPTDANVEANKWKVWSYEHIYTNGKPNAATQKFITYILSDEVQKGVLVKLGYISVANMSVERDATGNISHVSK
jgi:phosphate transport system substrate-binding protein